MQKIGGEFEINPDNLHKIDTSKYENNFLFSSSRAALWYLLKSLQSQSDFIHVPYYICESVINICLKTNFKIKFYEVDEEWLVPISYLKNVKTKEILLSVNYFGIISDNQRISQIREERTDFVIVSDHVQSYWTCETSMADYSITGLRKHFPIPEGGLLYKKNKLMKFDECVLDNSFYKDKLLGSILKFQKCKDNLYLNYLSYGEQLIDLEIAPTKASKISTYLFLNFNFEKAAYLRRRNYKFIYDYGQKLSLNFVFPFSEKCTPLVVPIFINDRNKVRKRLFEANIFLPIHWPLNSSSSYSIKSKKMANESLSLLVDHRYDECHIKYMLDCLIKI